ncbi:MAG: cell wall hydrolase [Lachnospiraceae bacterium]|nr:cell wall hydrolase [Lachnospiraceae bacterium]
MNRQVRRAVCALLVMVLVGSLFPISHAQATSATQQKIDEAERQRQQLQDQQQETRENLDDLRGERSVVRKQLDSLTEELEAISANLESLNLQITEKKEQIRETQNALAEAIRQEEGQYADMILRIRRMYEVGRTDILNTLFGAESVADFLNFADYYEKLEQYDRQKLAEFRANRELIEEQEAQLHQQEAQLQELLLEAQAEHEKVTELVEKAKKSISSYSSQISEEEARAREYEEQIKQKEADLEYLKKKLAEERALAQRAANGVWRDISEVTFEESDRVLLANLIYCEAGSEPYEGKVAVGAVVMNRVLSSVFPDTVSGVIYQNRQFSPVGSGRLAIALARGDATESCYRAADEAMSGVTNVGSCLFFRTPVEGLTGISIGGHIFYG